MYIKCLMVFTLIFIIGLSACSSAEITFPDSNLEAAMREAIHKPEGAIRTSDLEKVVAFSATGREIADITGLEHCTQELDRGCTSGSIGRYICRVLLFLHNIQCTHAVDRDKLSSVTKVRPSYTPTSIKYLARRLGIGWYRRCIWCVRTRIAWR